MQQSQSIVIMAYSSHATQASRFCRINIKVNGREYENVLPQLCFDVLLGQDFQQLHDKVTLTYGGDLPLLVICGHSLININPPELLANLTADCHTVATKSRRYPAEYREFIEQKVRRLLGEVINEPINYPWHAQLVIVRNESCKKRLVVDYLETINFDGYPLPCIDDIVNKIAQYRVFSTIDLHIAYHQVAMKDQVKPYTAFEAFEAIQSFSVWCHQRCGIFPKNHGFTHQKEGLVGFYANKTALPFVGSLRKSMIITLRDSLKLP